MADLYALKKYDVNLVYSGSYDSISLQEMRQDPVKKSNLEFVKFVSDCLSQDLGRDRVYYPHRDMLGGANFFDEFSDVTNGSNVTLLIVSKDIGDNAWYKWLNHMAFKNEKDNCGIKTIFLAVPGVTKRDIRSYKCEFMLVDSVVFADEDHPTSKDQVFRSRWYETIKTSISEYSGRQLPPTNRQISERARETGALEGRPPVMMSEDVESHDTPSHRLFEEETSASSYRSFEGPRGDVTPTAARSENTLDQAGLRRPQQATDVEPMSGIDGVLPSTKASKGTGDSVRVNPVTPSPRQHEPIMQTRNEDTTREPESIEKTRDENASRKPGVGSESRSEVTCRKPGVGSESGSEVTCRKPGVGAESENEDKGKFRWIYVAVPVTVLVLVFVWRHRFRR